MISAHVQFSVSRMTAGLIATDVASQVATATPLLLKVHPWHRFDAVAVPHMFFFMNASEPWILSLSCAGSLSLSLYVHWFFIYIYIVEIDR